MASAESVNGLPHDVIVDNILPRLPAMSLIRFKCVCKLWFQVISDPGFPKSHLLLQTPGQVSIRQGSVLFFKNFSDEKESYILNLFDILREPCLLPINSCNGLLLLRRQQGYGCPQICPKHYVINPVTRRHMKIPSPVPLTDCLMHSDNVSKQYKVLGWDAINDGSLARLYVVILGDCSIETEISCRAFKPPDFSTMVVCEPTLFNGWYHWVVKQRGNEELAVLAFNIEREEFKVMNIPGIQRMVALGGWRYKLVAMNGSLYLSQHHCLGGNCCYNIWSLDSCERQTWTEMCQYRLEYCQRCKKSDWDRYSSASTALLDVMEIIKRTPQFFSNVFHTNSLVWLNTKPE